MKTKSFKDMIKKEQGYSCGVDSFGARYENHPLTKPMVDYDHQRIESSGLRKVGDEVDGELFEWEKGF